MLPSARPQVLDNSTCTLWEAWRAIPPNLAGTAAAGPTPGVAGMWNMDIIAKFDLTTNQ